MIVTDEMLAAQRAEVEENFDKIADGIRRVHGQRDEFLAALIGLTNEVGGAFGAFESELRDAIGNTNYICISDKIHDARAAIAKAKGHEP